MVILSEENHLFSIHTFSCHAYSFYSLFLLLWLGHGFANPRQQAKSTLDIYRISALYPNLSKPVFISSAESESLSTVRILSGFAVSTDHFPAPALLSKNGVTLAMQPPQLMLVLNFNMFIIK
jgi:hypothetical protein